MEPVIVAFVAATPGLITALAALRRHERRITKSIGTPNGHGNVVEMLEDIRAWTLRHEGRHDLLEQKTWPAGDS